MTQAFKVFLDGGLFMLEMTDQLHQDGEPALFDVLVVALESPLHLLLLPLRREGVVLVGETLTDVLSLQHVGRAEHDREAQR